MRIEKINENQIKCILDKQELDSRKLKFAELAQGGENAKQLFQDMMKLAAAQFGFYAENSPLMIEAMPGSGETITLIVTKVKNLEELDSKIPRISYDNSYMEDMDDFDYYLDDMEEIDDLEEVSEFHSNELLDLFRSLKQKLSEAASQKQEHFIPLSDLLHNSKSTRQDASVPNDLPEKMTRIYSFEDLSTIMKLSDYLKNVYHGQNSLYKCPETNRYYLILDNSPHTLPYFAIICTMISEFGRPENSSAVSEAYYKEHFQEIISGNALEKLQKIYH